MTPQTDKETEEGGGRQREREKGWIKEVKLKVNPEESGEG